MTEETRERKARYGTKRPAGQPAGADKDGRAGRDSRAGRDGGARVRAGRVCHDIFRAIHEGKWLCIDYHNKEGQITRYWICIRGLDPDTDRKSVV